MSIVQNLINLAKIRTMKKLLPLLFLLVSFSILGQENKPEGEDFGFRLVSTPGYIQLQADEGCNWLTLSFSLWQQADPVFINQDGMLGSDSGTIEEHLKNSVFLITIARTEDGLHFKSFKGTNWVELKTDCPDEYCSIQVTEKGIKEYTDD